VDDLARATDDPRRFHDYLYALNQYLAGRGVTSMLLTETRRGGDPVPGYREVSNLSDNILLLEIQQDADLFRTLRVVKSRGSPHDTRRRALGIGAGGMTVS
jgi:KaiC/GvpD/RAD55 family RecA-like ATPase